MKANKEFKDSTAICKTVKKRIQITQMDILIIIEEII